MRFLNKILNRNNRRRLLSSFIFLIALGGATKSYAQSYPAQNSNYLDSVDFYLAHAAGFTLNALENVNTEMRGLDTLPVTEQFKALAKIGRQLEQIDIDSAMIVYRAAEHKARAEKNERYTNKFRYRKGSVLAMMGLVREGIDMYRSIPPGQVDIDDKVDYFATGRHIFDAAVDYYRVDSLKQKYQLLSGIYNDSILAYVKPQTVESKYYNGLDKLSGKDRESGIAELINVLNSVEVEHPLFAKAAAEIASCYLLENDLPNAKYYLAISAISDLKAGTRETTSLHRLGKLLNYEEDYSRAYDYLTYALEAAVNSGSNLRTIEIGEIMPAVVKAARKIENRHQKMLIVAVIALSVAVIIFICFIIYAGLTRRHMRATRKKLVEINDSKDLYIRKLLSLCGAYLSALENFNKLAGRKIKVGQFNELLSMIESGKVMREQLQSFHEVFDEAFMIVYPDFIDNVNALLQPDSQLRLSDDGTLGTELRIVAFMRLGVDDSAQIARFLGLSLNTIYTYRNKVKSRAKNRATFEQDIRNIGRHNED